MQRPWGQLLAHDDKRALKMNGQFEKLPELQIGEEILGYLDLQSIARLAATHAGAYSLVSQNDHMKAGAVGLTGNFLNKFKQFYEGVRGGAGQFHTGLEFHDEFFSKWSTTTWTPEMFRYAFQFVACIFRDRSDYHGVRYAALAMAIATSPSLAAKELPDMIAQLVEPEADAAPTAPECVLFRVNQALCLLSRHSIDARKALATYRHGRSGPIWHHPKNLDEFCSPGDPYLRFAHACYDCFIKYALALNDPRANIEVQNEFRGLNLLLNPYPPTLEQRARLRTLGAQVW